MTKRKIVDKTIKPHKAAKPKKPSRGGMKRTPGKPQVIDPVTRDPKGPTFKVGDLPNTTPAPPRPVDPVQVYLDPPVRVPEFSMMFDPELETYLVHHGQIEALRQGAKRVNPDVKMTVLE